MTNHTGNILEYDQITCAIQKLNKSAAISLTQQVERATVTTTL